jgi:hypothetical protein
MKLAKGRRRARMNPDTLNNLLTISLMGQSIEEFNPKECKQVVKSVRVHSGPPPSFCQLHYRERTLISH